MKALEDLKEMLEDQLKKITKKGDITPQELDSAYKAVDVLKDIDDLMQNEQQSQGGMGGQSQRGGRGMNSNNSYDGSYGNSNNSYAPMSYGPIWNRPDMMMAPYSMENSRRGSYDGSYDGGNSRAGRRGRDGDGDGQYSEDGGSYDYSSDYSGRRGRNQRTGRYMSRDGGSYESREYSRHSAKERMIDKLETMMDITTNEKDRMAIMQCIDKLES